MSDSGIPLTNLLSTNLEALGARCDLALVWIEGDRADESCLTLTVAHTRAIRDTAKLAAQQLRYFDAILKAASAA